MITVGDMLKVFYDKFMSDYNIYFTTTFDPNFDNERNVVVFEGVVMKTGDLIKDYKITVKSAVDDEDYFHFIKSLEYFSESVVKIINYNDEQYAVRIIKNTEFETLTTFLAGGHRISELSVALNVTKI